ARGWRTGDELSGTSGRATMGPLKVIIDGSLNTRTAYCYDAYPGQAGPHAHGLLTVGADELVDVLTVARRAGIAAALPPTGVPASARALDAVSRLGQRGSIEHAQLLTTADVARMAERGLVACVQAEHAVDDRDVADRYWAGRTDRAFPFRALAEAGVPLAFGS